MSADDEGRDEVLQGLAREAEPPAALEREVVAQLRRRDLIRAGSRAPSVLASAATLFATLALGLWIGGRFTPAPAPVAEATAGQRYLLLLYEPRPLDRAGLDLVAEYSAWAGELARLGQLVVAEKLNADARRLGAVPASDPPAAGTEPTGFFLIRAGSFDEALAIARRCPHLAHGGEVSLRPIDPT